MNKIRLRNFITKWNDKANKTLEQVADACEIPMSELKKQALRCRRAGCYLRKFPRGRFEGDKTQGHLSEDDWQELRDYSNAMAPVVKKKRYRFVPGKRKS